MGLAESRSILWEWATEPELAHITPNSTSSKFSSLQTKDLTWYSGYEGPGRQEPSHNYRQSDFFNACHCNGAVFRANFVVREFSVCMGENRNQCESKLIKIIIQKRHFSQRHYCRTIKKLLCKRGIFYWRQHFFIQIPMDWKPKSRVGKIMFLVYRIWCNWDIRREKKKTKPKQ